MAYRRYSIYRLKDDMPIAIYETAERCAEILGVETDTFREYLSRQRQGRYSRGVEIFRDDVDPGDLLPITKKCYGLKPLDFRIVGLKIAGFRQVEIARLTGQDPGNVCRRLKRVASKYGYAPWERWSLEQLEQEVAAYYRE